MNPKLFLDARKLVDGGIGVYIENIINGLLEYTNVEITALVPAVIDRPIKGRDFSGWKGRINTIVDSSANYSVSEFLIGLRYKSEIQKHHLFHSPHYTLPFFIPCAKAVTIHDVIHCSHPDSFYHRPISRLIISNAASRGDVIITGCNASRLAIGEEIGRWDSKINVVYHAIKNLDGKLALNNDVSGGKSILFVGNTRAHKGFEVLLKAFAALHKYYEKKLKLVCVGTKTPLANDAIQELGLNNNIVFTSNLSAEQLASLYRRASVTVVPSKIEGFGLVALEAMSLGCPVVCSDIPSLREICGDCVLYAQPDSVKEFVSQIDNCLSDSESRNKRVEEGIFKAKEFGLEPFIKSTIQAYAKAAPIFNDSFNNTESYRSAI